MNNDPSIDWNRVAIRVLDSLTAACFAACVAFAADGSRFGLVFAAYMLFAQLQKIGDKS